MIKVFFVPSKLLLTLIIVWSEQALHSYESSRVKLQENYFPFCLFCTIYYFICVLLHLILLISQTFRSLFISIFNSFKHNCSFLWNSFCFCFLMRWSVLYIMLTCLSCRWVDRWFTFFLHWTPRSDQEMPFSATRAAQELDFAAPSGEKLCFQCLAGCPCPGKGRKEGQSWAEGLLYFTGSSAAEDSCPIFCLYPPLVFS